MQGIHRWPLNSPHKGPVTRKMFPFDDVIMGVMYVFYLTTPNIGKTEIVFTTLLNFVGCRFPRCSSNHSKSTAPIFEINMVQAVFLLVGAEYMVTLACYNSPLLSSVALGWVEFNPRLSKYIHVMPTPALKILIAPIESVKTTSIWNESTEVLLETWKWSKRK